MITIITAAQDFHALTIQGRIKNLGHKECHIIECDRLAQSCALSYRVDRLNIDVDRVLTANGEYIRPSDSKILWLRRIRANQILFHPLEKPEAYEIMNNDCRGAMSGFMATKLTGKWISTPEASFKASDKIYQLRVAADCGFRIPKTLISQSRQDVCKFFEECNGRIIVKPVVGVSEPFLRTTQIRDPEEFSEDAYFAAPAIYQELIEGSRHLRLLSFGAHILCGIIDSPELDWRPNLTVPISEYHVNDWLAEKVRGVLRRLGLEMGVVDIKLTPEGEPVWFEVNPQGQFLFLEPLTKINFIDRFARYLIEEASTHPN